MDWLIVAVIVACGILYAQLNEIKRRIGMLINLELKKAGHEGVFNE